jgi:predicted transglutaminase-like cysteine proteinase
MKTAIAALLLGSVLLTPTAPMPATLPPTQAVSFCQRTPALCLPSIPDDVPAARRGDVIAVNLQVNRAVFYRAETTDRWDLAVPGAGGDCEDYALTKMYLLLWRGIPRGAMRIAVVHADGMPTRRNHAVLLVRIGGTEYVLDNATPIMWPADADGYTWLSTEREGLPMVWDTLTEAPR